MKYIVCSWMMLIGCAVQCYGSQEIDTTKVYSIPEVVVSDRYQTREVRSAVPLQIFSHEELKNLNVMQVSDAVKHFSGVTVKDYGGIGENSFYTQSGSTAYSSGIRWNSCYRLSDRTGGYRSLFIGKCRPSDVKQRAK